MKSEETFEAGKGILLVLAVRNYEQATVFQEVCYFSALEKLG